MTTRNIHPNQNSIQRPNRRRWRPNRSHLGVLLAVVLTSSIANADILTVTNNSDSGIESLRDTVTAATAGDVIVFNQTLDGQTITLGGTPITIDKDLVIDATSLLNGITINGNGTSRIFTITGGNVVLMSLSLENGSESSGFGGSIASSGTALRIVNCTISNNSAQNAGAINSSSPLVIINSTIANNSCTGGISGIYATNSNLTIIGSTLSGNNGNDADAIRFESGTTSTLRFYDSTISGNTSQFRAAGLTIAGFNSALINATIENSTITNNTRTTAGGAGGLFIVQADTSDILVEAKSCIISGNTSAGVPGITGEDLAPTSEFNLIGVGGGLVDGNNSNIVGVTDPMLSPLQDNGGPTLTHIPITNSPVLDTGTSFLVEYDQRGFARLVGAGVDIGSVEGVDHTAARAALNATITALQNRAKRFQKKAKTAKTNSRKRKFAKQVKLTNRQISAARVQLAALNGKSDTSGKTGGLKSDSLPGKAGGSPIVH